MERLKASVLAAALLAAGCTTITRASFTQAEQAVAVVPGIPDARFWADAPDAAARILPPRRAGTRPVMLALSGGADDGAYGAGLLNGWTQSGKRPTFTVVTGVSTGALIAPFAFLGPAYDAELARVYTTIGARDVYRPRFPLAIPGSVSAASTAPLQRLIERYVTDALVDAVAAEHRAGRRLLVGTVNLDAQRITVWDMGAIAASGAPDRRALFRRVLLASSAIPAIFPPVVIRTEANGRPIDELHVDGATAAQFLSVPRQLILSPTALPQGFTLYLLVNNRLGGGFRLVTPRTLPILERAFALNQQSALLSLVNTSFLYARANNVDFNLSFIGNEVPTSPTLFDTAYMRRLYDYGFARGRSGDFWQKQPPSAAQQAVTGEP